MLPELAQALTSMTAAYNLSKAAFDVGQGVARDHQAFELQRHILAAQESAMAANTAQTTLIDEIRDLKERLRQFENWEAERENYQLTEIAPGVFASVLKPEVNSTQPPHRLCANCFEARKKSFLQSEPIRHRGSQTVKCHSCSSELHIWRDDLPEKFPQSSGSRRSERRSSEGWM